MRRLIFYFVAIVSFCAISCDNFKSKFESEKEYKYIEKVKERDIFGGISTRDAKPEIIKATTDSMAYIKAYRGFCLSKKVRKDMKGANMETYTEPISFKLLNEQNKDIFGIYFDNKDSIKTSIEREILDSPSLLE